MYYKSLIETLKDEDKENRITINEQTTDNNICYIDATLAPKDINNCPNCSSKNIIKFGKKDRVIKDDYLSNRIKL